MLIIEIDCDPALYPKVNAILGVDPSTGSGDWPKGIRTHVGAGGDGAIVVVEVWESRADAEAFMERLGPAMGQAGVPQPRRMEWLSLLGNVSF